MSILKSSKVSNGQQVMNMASLARRASLTNTVSTSHCCKPSSFPSNAVGSGYTAFPSWVGRTNIKFGLPFSHTSSIAKDPIRMKIGGRACNVLAAPFARMCFAVSAGNVWLPTSAGVTTWFRAIFLLAVAITEKFSASLAGQYNCFSPATFKETGPRAERLWLLRRAAVERMEGLLARLAIPCFISISHVRIIPKNEAYCEMAAASLSQNVFDLEAI